MLDDKKIKDFYLEAVKIDGLNLAYAPKNLQNDVDIVMEAVKNNGLALAYASYELSANKHVVMEAVKNNGLALAYASYELSANKRVVMEAVKNNGNALRYASKNLQNDSDVVSIANATLNHSPISYYVDCFDEANKENNSIRESDLEWLSVSLKELKYHEKAIQSINKEIDEFLNDFEEENKKGFSKRLK